MKPFQAVLEWYRTHQTASQIGFDPDGMCLKICRTAAGKPAVYPSAVEAQRATPQQHRVHKVRDLRRGMVLYYDHPSDSNPFGHIVTMIGRVKGANPDSLHDILVETNSVKANEVVVVRGDYFPQHWGDPFVFGATWLNGSEIDYAGRTKPQPEPEPEPTPTRGGNVDQAIEDLTVAEKRAKEGTERDEKLDRVLRVLNKIPFLKEKKR
jgi:hypothetical protein